MVGNGTDGGTCQCDSFCCSLSKLPTTGGKGGAIGFGEFRTSLHWTNGSPECGICLVWKSEVGQILGRCSVPISLQSRSVCSKENRSDQSSEGVS